MSERKTFIFIYGNIYVGGIELYLVRLIKKLKQEEHRIIWFTKKDVIIDETLEEVFLDTCIEKVYVKLNDLNSIKKIRIDFDKNEEIFAFAFNPISFMQIEILKKNYKNVTINSFYWVSHFKGLFLEDLVNNKFLQLGFKNLIGKVIKDMDKNDNIIYVNQSHLDAFESRYNYKARNLEKKFIESSKEFKPFDLELARKRSERNEFNIITVSRFDFPHKAYVIGLIESFGKLKKKYKHLKLTIIGYGKDQDRVIKAINNLESNIKKDIKLIGKVKYDNLKKYFNEAHLNIGVASTISDGSLTGLISIPVRHYSEKCEGYDYLPESKDMTLSSEPGIPIEVIIEDVMLMDSNQYIDLCKKSFNTYAKKNSDILSFMDLTNKNPHITLSWPYLWVFTTLKRLKDLFKKRKK